MAAPSGAAEAGGIPPGLPLTDARARIPNLGAFPADPAGDAEALARLAEWCGAYTPWTAPEDPGDAGEASGGGGAGIWLDATGCAHLFGGEAGLGRALVARMRRLGFTARAGLAGTPGAAWAVARFGRAGGEGADGRRDEDVRIVPPGCARAALAPLPVVALRLPADVAEGLRGLGLRSVGDLSGVPRGPLTARFGEVVTRRLDQALGRAFEPVSPRPAAAPMRVRVAPAEPLGRHADIAAGLERLLRRLEGRLRRKHLGARELVLRLHHVDGGVSRASVGTSRPARDPDHLFRLFAERLEDLDPGFGIEAMVLAAPATEPLPAEQIPLASRRVRTAPAELGALVDRLRSRLGAESVMRFDVRESHVPERAAAPVPVFRRGPSAAPAPPARRRPVRLLPRPEGIEATAMVPDGPPAMVRWRRVPYRIARAEGPERIAPEWWSGTAPWDAPWDLETRDYYRLEAVDGARFWVFREGLYRMAGEAPGDPPRWYLHGLFA